VNGRLGRWRLQRVALTPEEAGFADAGMLAVLALAGAPIAPQMQCDRNMKKNIWRRPTLAEAIQPLPLAMLRLTAEFGMGSGRTTALWPPKKFIKERAFSEIYTQGSGHGFISLSLKSQFPFSGKKAIKPHDRLVSVR
jgi:hypothetical protein